MLFKNKNRFIDLEHQLDKAKEKISALTQELDLMKKEGRRMGQISSVILTSIAGLEQQVVELDSQNLITQVNTPFIKYSGLDREDLIGKPLSLIDKFFWGPGYLEVLVQLVREKKERIEKERSYYNPEKGQDTFIKISVHLTEMKNVQIVIKDVSEFKQLETKFSSYVSAQVLDKMKTTGRDFGVPERYEMSVIFADLRGFMTMSEKMVPEQIRTLLNAFLEGVISVVDKNEAMLDKIVGDQVIIACGAPIPLKQHAVKALKISIEMQNRHIALVEQWRRKGLLMPQLGIGIGTGSMVVGNIGIEKRFNYTVLGQSVNLASRLCALAGPGQIFISQESYESILKDDPVWAQREMIIQKFDKATLHGETIQGNLYFMEAAGVAPIILSEETESDIKPVKTFGDYEILMELARGGMGVVYKAIHRELGRIIALKVLMAGTIATEAQIKRFKREAEATARLKHPNIVSIYNVGIAEGKHFIVMDFIEGITLDHFIKEFLVKDAKHDIEELIKSKQFKDRIEIHKTIEKKFSSDIKPETRIGESMPLSQVVTLMIKILNALEYAHSKGVLHRDIKPSNIIINREGEPIIMDFGLAAHIGEGDSSLTKTGQILGTPTYMAPEQTQGNPDIIDERTDIYSLGLILFEMLTGRPRFIPAGNIALDLKNISESELIGPRKFNSKIPVEIDNICKKAMAKRQDDRYRTVHAFKNDLVRYLQGEAVGAKPVGFLTNLQERLMKYKTFSVAGIILFLSMIVFSTYNYRIKLKEQGKWHVLWKDEFFSEKDPFSWKLYRVYSSAPQGFDSQVVGLDSNICNIRDGELKIRNSTRSAYFLSSSLNFGDNFRMEFDWIIPDSAKAGQVGFFFCGQAPYQGYTYLANIGGRNSNYIVKGSWPEGILSRNYSSKLMPQRSYHVAVIKKNSLIRIMIDRIPIYEYEEMIPLLGPNHQGCGFYFGPETDINFDNIKLFRWESGIKTTPLLSGNKFFERGHYEEAVAEYQNIAQGYPDEDIAHMAADNIGMALIYLNQYDQSYQAFKAMAQTYKNDLEKMFRYLFLQAHCLRKMRQFSEAHLTFMRCLKERLNPTIVSNLFHYYYGSGKFLYEIYSAENIKFGRLIEQDFLNAMLELIDVQQLELKNSFIYITVMERFFALGEFKKGEHLYSLVQLTFKHDGGACAAAGIALVESYLSALQIDKALPVINEMIDEYTEVLSVQDMLKFEKMRVLTAHGDYDTALQTGEDLIHQVKSREILEQIYPLLVYLYPIVGKVSEGAAQLDSMSHYLKSETTPDFEEILKSHLFLEAGDLGKARRLLQSYMDNPRNISMLSYRYYLLAQLNLASVDEEDAEVLRWADSLKAHFPMEDQMLAQIQVVSADHLYALGEIEKSRTAYQNIIEHYSGFMREKLISQSLLDQIDPNDFTNQLKYQFANDAQYYIAQKYKRSGYVKSAQNHYELSLQSTIGKEYPYHQCLMALDDLKQTY